MKSSSAMMCKNAPGVSAETRCVFFPVVDGLVDAAVAGTGGQSVSDVLYDMGLPDVVLTPECHACFCIPSLITQLVARCLDSCVGIKR